MADALHVLCPRCDAKNRLKPELPALGVKCGKCASPLFDGRPVELSGERFDKHVRENDLPLLVDFWAPWCGPCRMMAPAFEKAAGLLQPQVRLAKLNTQEDQATAARLGIQGIPTMVLFRQGREAARISGAMDAERIVAWVRQQLGR